MWQGGRIEAGAVELCFSIWTVIGKLVVSTVISGLGFEVMLNLHKSMGYFVQHGESGDYTALL